MGRDLTKRYASGFGSHLIARIVSFAIDVQRTDKWRELSSFVVWEVLHRCRLFGSQNYLKFTSEAPRVLDEQFDVGKPEFSDLIANKFAEHGLQATRCSQNWKLVHLRADGGLIGSRYPNDNELYEGTSELDTVCIDSFSAPIKAIYLARSKTVFVCIKGAVYRRAPDCLSFSRVLSLASSQSFFRHNNGMTELPSGVLIIGEYGNVWNGRGWKNLALLYSSTDDGITWSCSEYLREHGANKHVHLVKYLTSVDKVVVADGDNHKKLWISDPCSPNHVFPSEWRAVNRFHIQMGGYTSMIEQDGHALFGTDYQGGTNFVVGTDDGVRYRAKVVPDPYRRSPIDNMLLRRSVYGSEVWANLPYSSGPSKCLLMFSRDAGKSWNRVFEYSRDTRLVWLISSSTAETRTFYFSVEDTRKDTRCVYKVGDLQ